MATVPPIPTTSEPRRFSIRLPRPWGIGVVAVVLLVVGTGLRFGLPIYRQQVAISEIERVGGVVRTNQPGSFSGWTGDKRFSPFYECTQVYLGRSNCTDADLACLRELKAIRTLTLHNTQVTDAGLVHLNCLSRLAHLDVRNTRITDLGLSQLNGLTQLTVLQYDGSRVTEAGASKLKKASPRLKLHR